MSKYEFYSKKKKIKAIKAIKKYIFHQSLLNTRNLLIPRPLSNLEPALPKTESHKLTGATETAEPTHCRASASSGRCGPGWEKARLACPFVLLCHTTL